MSSDPPSSCSLPIFYVHWMAICQRSIHPLRTWPCIITILTIGPLVVVCIIILGDLNVFVFNITKLSKTKKMYWAAIVFSPAFLRSHRYPPMDRMLHMDSHRLKDLVGRACCAVSGRKMLYGPERFWRVWNWRSNQRHAYIMVYAHNTELQSFKLAEIIIKRFSFANLFQRVVLINPVLSRLHFQIVGRCHGHTICTRIHHHEPITLGRRW